jgi:hypothetical protein
MKSMLDNLNFVTNVWAAGTLLVLIIGSVLTHDLFLRFIVLCILAIIGIATWDKRYMNWITIIAIAVFGVVTYIQFNNFNSNKPIARAIAPRGQ